MKNFDERQEQVRGRIMTRAFLITIILMLLAAFLNDMHLYDFEKNVDQYCLYCYNIRLCGKYFKQLLFWSAEGWQNGVYCLCIYRVIGRAGSLDDL